MMSVGLYVDLDGRERRIHHVVSIRWDHSISKLRNVGITIPPKYAEHLDVKVRRIHWIRYRLDHPISTSENVRFTS